MPYKKKFYKKSRIKKYYKKQCYKKKYWSNRTCILQYDNIRFLNIIAHSVQKAGHSFLFHKNWASSEVPVNIYPKEKSENTPFIQYKCSYSYHVLLGIFPPCIQYKCSYSYHVLLGIFPPIYSINVVIPIMSG